MKKIFIIITLTLTVIACKENKTAANDAEQITNNSTTDSIGTVEPSSAALQPNEKIDNTNPLSTVYKIYFDLKDALAKDDGKTAQINARNLLSEIGKVPIDKFTVEQNNIWTKFQKKLSFDAEHISSVDENEHQREHFVSLSKNMFEVMKVIKNDKTVYYQKCPMANDGKGANWLSLNSKISNPYMGKAMLTCGSTIETIK